MTKNALLLQQIAYIRLVKYRVKSHIEINKIKNTHRVVPQSNGSRIKTKRKLYTVVYHCNGSTKFAISASILYNLLVLKFPWICLRVRFIVLQTVFSAELDELLRKRLLYSFSVVNVSRYCYMAWKPVCLTSIRLILSLTDFL